MIQAVRIWETDMKSKKLTPKQIENIMRKLYLACLRNLTLEEVQKIEKEVNRTAKALGEKPISDKVVP